MVLLACYECGNDVSSSAASCPKCGAPCEPQDSAPASPRPLQPAPTPLPATEGAPTAPAKKIRQRREKVAVVLALVLLAFGGYELATKSQGTDSAWLALAGAFLILLPMLPKCPPRGLRPKVVCKHCNVAGHVIVSHAERKRGISGGKATGALLTGGLSLLAVGLSRKEAVSSMRCKNCGMKWDE